MTEKKEPKTIKMNPDEGINVSQVGDEEKSQQNDDKQPELTDSQKVALQAAQLLEELFTLVSNGAVRVRILKPRKKGNEYLTGRVISISTDLTHRRIKVRVAYNVGRDMKIDGKKRYVPYSDIFSPKEITPIEVIDVHGEFEAERERIKKLKEEKSKFKN